MALETSATPATSGILDLPRRPESPPAASLALVAVYSVWNSPAARRKMYSSVLRPPEWCPSAGPAPIDRSCLLMVQSFSLGKNSSTFTDVMMWYATYMFQN